MPESPEKSIDALLGSGGISQLLQNPEIAAKLPRIMEALAPVMAEMKAERAAGASAPPASVPPAADAPPSAPPAAAEAVADPAAAAAATAATAAPAGATAAAASAASAGKGSPVSRRMALLRALSPYLSPERQSALDTVMKVSTLLDLLTEVL